MEINVDASVVGPLMAGAVALFALYAGFVMAEAIERWSRRPGYMRRWGIRRR